MGGWVFDSWFQLLATVLDQFIAVLLFCATLNDQYFNKYEYNAE